MKKIISTTKAPAAIGPYSQAIVANGMLFASGQLGIDPKTGCFVEGGVTEQALQAFHNVKAILEEAGYNMERIIGPVLYIRQIEEYGNTIMILKITSVALTLQASIWKLPRYSQLALLMRFRQELC